MRLDVPRVVVALLIGLVLGLAGVQGFAQTWPDSVEASVEDEAWNLYYSAFMEMYRGRPDAARGLLEQMVEEHPNHPAASLAGQALAAMGPGPVVGEPERVGGEAASGQARAELVIYQTLHGIAVGGEVCFLLYCDDPRSIVGSLALGAAGGLGISLYATRNGIRPGQSAAINSGTTWGFWSGLTLANALDLDENPFVTSMLVGQFVGLGTGAALWHVLRPTSGNVSAVNSGGIWTTAAIFLLGAVIQPDISDQMLFGSFFAASNLGLIGGAIFASQYPMSRSRVLVIDAGGLLGLLLTTGVVALADGGGRAAGAAGLVGMFGGLGAATYLSRDWDLGESNAQMFLLPTDEGALVGVGGTF